MAMVDKILNIVCARYNLTREEMAIKKSRRQLVNIVAAKQEAAYLLKIHTTLMHKEIAVLLAYGTKQDIGYAIRRIHKIAEGNKSYRKELNEIKAELTGEPSAAPTQAPLPLVTKIKAVCYLKTLEGEYYSLDDNSKLITGEEPELITKIIVERLSPELRIVCTGSAAKILRFVNNRNPSTARCIISVNGTHYSLDFNSRQDKPDGYVIPGTPCRVEEPTTMCQE
jgi:hypothetical protein